MVFEGSAVPGIVHHYAPRLTAFEHTAASSNPENLLIFIAGLFDGLLTVPYPSQIAASLPPSWSLAQVLLSSAYTGWGISSLQKDATELSQCISYFRSLKTNPRRKIVIMGHSTGCQDVMEYLVGKDAESREKVQGGIIQASVSDREAIVQFFPQKQYDDSVACARKMITEGRGEDIMPLSLTKGFTSQACCSARRWLSLAEVNGDDDYFSSDLSDEQLQTTFGRIPKGVKLGIFFSGEDQYVPKSVDKKALVEKWVGVVKAGTGEIDEMNSGVVVGATHNLTGNPEPIVQDLVRRVMGFLEGI